MSVSRDLKAMGYRLPGAGSLKPKHVAALVAHWKGSGISDATIKNRMSWVRWWAMKTSKPGLVPKDNGELGLADKAVNRHRNGTPDRRAIGTPLGHTGWAAG